MLISLSHLFTHIKITKIHLQRTKNSISPHTFFFLFNFNYSITQTKHYVKELEMNDKQNGHSSSLSANELMLIESSTDNELIINTNGLDAASMNGKLSADLSPNDLMMSSSRSTSPSDKENGMDTPPRACIMRALSIVSFSASFIYFN